MDNAEQRKNDLTIIIICCGHVLRHTEPLKEAVLGNDCYVGGLLNFWFSVSNIVP
jgi:hypothetical protein